MLQVATVKAPEPTHQDFSDNEVEENPIYEGVSDSKSAALPDPMSLRQSSLPQLPLRHSKAGASSEITSQINRISKVVDNMLREKDREREKMKMKIRKNTE